MTLRRVRTPVLGAVDDPSGRTVILTVEEYRERIDESYTDGADTAYFYAKSGVDSAISDWWNDSATKKRLDEEVEP